MNIKAPDCNAEDYLKYPRDLPAVTRNNTMGGEEDLMELLWENGNVIMHSQNHWKVPGANSELKQAQKPPIAKKCVHKFDHTPGNLGNLIQDDGNASWFQFPLDEPIDKDFCSEFFSDIVMGDAIFGDKISKNVDLQESGHVKIRDTHDSSSLATSCALPCTTPHQENPLPPDVGLSRPASSLKNDSVLNFPHISNLGKGKVASANEQLNKVSECLTKVRGQESSIMTLGSSKCASNHIVTDIGPSRTLSSGTAGVVAGGIQKDARMIMNSERVQNNVHEVTITASSSGSDNSVERIRQKRTRNHSHKRKGRESEDFGFQSEEADYESIEPKKPAKHRSRAAEVHNLAERRRRDRINEKMKTLQELIPHCNKTDKASMLDEAIEYLKSLQMQVQMMWMSGSMGQMMFPGVQQYFSGIGMGLGQVPLPTAQNAGHSVASGSVVNQRVPCPSTGLNMLNFPRQMQRVLPEPYGCYLGFQQMQPQPQALNFNSYGSTMLQQDHSTSMPSSNILPGAQGASSETFFMTNNVDH